MHNSKNMNTFTSIVRRAIVFSAMVLYCNTVNAQSPAPKFKVVAFYTGKSDRAHISFVNEAKRWFPEMAAKYNFAFEATTNWSQLNEEFSQAIPGGAFSGHPAGGPGAAEGI